MFTHLITITTYHIDSEDTQTLVIECDKQLEVTDKALLSYLLNVDMEDERIDVCIELLDDIKQTVYINDTIRFMLIEQFNGKLTMRTQSLPITEITDKYIGSLFQSTNVFRMHQHVCRSVGNTDNYALAIDLNRVSGKISTRTCDERIDEIIKRYNLGSVFLYGQIRGHIEFDQSISVHLLYFPDTQHFLECRITNFINTEGKSDSRISGSLHDSSGNHTVISF